MITTNTHQPKVNHVNDKYLVEMKDENGNPTGTVVSKIPRRFVTTNLPRPATHRPLKLADFPTVRKVEPRKVDKKMRFNSANLQDIQKRNKRSAQGAAAILDEVKDIDLKLHKGETKPEGAAFPDSLPYPGEATPQKAIGRKSIAGKKSKK